MQDLTQRCLLTEMPVDGLLYWYVHCVDISQFGLILALIQRCLLTVCCIDMYIVLTRVRWDRCRTWQRCLLTICCINMYTVLTGVNVDWYRPWYRDVCWQSVVLICTLCWQESVGTNTRLDAEMYVDSLLYRYVHCVDRSQLGLTQDLIQRCLEDTDSTIKLHGCKVSLAIFCFTCFKGPGWKLICCFRVQLSIQYFPFPSLFPSINCRQVWWRYRIYYSNDLIACVLLF